MKVRLITSALGIVLFFAVLFAPVTVFYIVDIIIAGVAIHEVFSVVGLTKKPTMVVAGALGIILCACFGAAHMGYFDYNICMAAIVALLAYLFAVLVFDHSHVKLYDAAMAFFCILFPALLFSYIVPVRGAEHGMYLIVTLFAATWCGDAGAYFVGIKFGKHKLAPILSPKKTWEGAFGGVLGSVLGMVIYSLVLLYVLKVPCNTVALVLVGIVCSVIGPVADIATSAIKREFGVKDFGTLFPGHGGILDRFDSVLLTAPFVYFVSQMVNLIG